MTEKTIQKKCVKCGIVESLLLNKTYYYKNAKIKSFRDKRGRYWNGNHCHSCSLARARKNLGHKPRHLSKKKNIMIAYQAEKIAGQRFRDLGFSVEMGHGAGPDFFAEIGNTTWKVEVKRAVYQSRKWRVHKVTKARSSDDLVAIVLPNKYVYIDSMSNHLKHCSKCGDRAITSIVKEYG